MNMEALKYFIEYFDLKDFIINNHPMKLLAILITMLVLMFLTHILCDIFQKRMIRYAEKNLRHLAKDVQKPNEPDTEPSIDPELFGSVMKYARLLIYLLIFGWALNEISLGPAYKAALEIIFTCLCTLVAVLFICASIPFEMDIYVRKRGSRLKETQMRSLLPIIQGVIWAIGITFLLDNVGLHVSTILAGLGIVGVAVGLAGQAILSDFFSYLVILVDKPFKVGDFMVLSNGKSGSVQYLGPKTTRLLSLDGDTIICANTEMTKGVIVNQGSIEEREVTLEVGVAFTCSVATLKRVPGLLEGVIKSFEQCRFERACMVAFGTSNFLFQLIYRVVPQPGGLNAFMQTRSDVNIAIQDMLTRENIPGSYPTQTVLLNRMTFPSTPPTEPSSSAPGAGNG